MKEKLSKEEKAMIKALVMYDWKVNGYRTTEYSIMHITGNRNIDHRMLVEAYIDEIKPGQVKDLLP